MFGGSGPSAPPPVAPPPEEPQTTQASRKAQLAERQKADKRQGRRASILTGPQGLTEEATTTKKRLLGA